MRSKWLPLAFLTFAVAIGLLFSSMGKGGSVGEPDPQHLEPVLPRAQVSSTPDTIIAALKETPRQQRPAWDRHPTLAHHDRADASYPAPVDVTDTARTTRSPGGTPTAELIASPEAAAAQATTANTGAAPRDASTTGISRAQADGSEVSPSPSDLESDKEAPSLISIAFDPPEVDAGESVRVLVSVVDDLSGIRSISGMIENPGRSATIGFGAGRSIGEGLYEGSIRIPETAEEGRWRVRHIALEDKARNRRQIASPPAGFVVGNNEGDAQPPEVVDLWVEQPSIAPGGSNRIVIDARDDGSGIATISGTYTNKAGTAEIRFSAAREGTTDRWAGAISIPQSADCGDWRLASLILRDRAANQKVHRGGDALLERGTFFVSFNEACDNEAPLLQSFSFDSAAVENSVETPVRIVAFLQDQSGVASAYGRIAGPRNEEGKEPSIAYSLKEEGGAWVGTFTIPRHAASGRWFVSYLQVEDKAKNRKVYRSDDPALATAVIDVR